MFTLTTLTEMAIYYTGSQPTFRLDPRTGSVEIVDASSGFLKMVYADPKVMAHLHNGVVSVQYFK